MTHKINDSTIQTIRVILDESTLQSIHDTAMEHNWWSLIEQAESALIEAHFGNYSGQSAITLKPADWLALMNLCTPDIATQLIETIEADSRTRVTR